MEQTYCVYIVTNLLDTVLYIGVTNNICRRLDEHRAGVIRGFTAKYHLKKLVYYETTTDVISAIAREKQLKGWKRERKIALIESQNPGWKDLSLEFA